MSAGVLAPETLFGADSEPQCALPFGRATSSTDLRQAAASLRFVGIVNHVVL